ncbi:L-rhamnose mutarotase [Agilicoccus flavus]|uniref:L-rhamnose mutarotase n=1 Tax=Agilicoccus flavus TaxID=2775968 RepID=UPI001CF629FB|nr:L-rhamnose mutarotase [Agilicoccus flavus]
MVDTGVTRRLAASAMSSPQRACFLLRVRPERLEPYLEAHEHVWSDMRQALTDCGWQHYSLFVDPQDGLVVGYFETRPGTTTAQAMEAMSGQEVDARWQAGMADYFTSDGGTPRLLSQYFYLP